MTRQQKLNDHMVPAQGAANLMQGLPSLGAVVPHASIELQWIRGHTDSDSAGLGLCGSHIRFGAR